MGIAEFVDPSCCGIADLVDSLEFCSFKNVMFIDVDLLYALQILPETRKSPNINSKSQKLSLYDLLNNTVTTEGAKLLKDWVRKPLTNIDKLLERQNTVKILSQSELHEIRSNIRKGLKYTKNSKSIVNGLGAGKLNWQVWKNLVLFLQNVMYLLKQIRLGFLEENLPTELALFYNQELMIAFNELEKLILLYAEPITSEEDNKLRIINGVDDTLDELRIQYNNLEEVLQETTRIIAANFLEEVFNTVYIPQLGFLVSREADVQTADSTFMPNEWQEVFRTSTNIYYKTDEVWQLDEQYGDIYTSINDREIEIIQSMLAKVSEFNTVIIQVGEAAVELDCLCSLSEVSQFRNYSFPCITDTNELEIVQGRHPLVETFLNMFVPNDTIFDSEEKIMVVTGANLSGKSVYLNQTALIVVMAQIGCAIPAENATLGIVDKILTRILSRESLDKQQSTFAIDVYQLSKCISLATDRSLVIVDEFGKGSDPIDSTSMFGGTLSYFKKKSLDCPRCIFSTHFLDLFKDKEFCNMYQSPKIKMMSTEILLEKTTNSMLDNVTYLYKVKPGLATKSFGIYCAKLCGISEKVIQRAEYIAQMLDNGDDVAYELTKLSEEEEQNYSVAKAVVTKFLEIEFEDAELSINDSIRYMAKFDEIFQS